VPSNCYFLHFLASRAMFMCFANMLRSWSVISMPWYEVWRSSMPYVNRAEWLIAGCGVMTHIRQETINNDRVVVIFFSFFPCLTHGLHFRRKHNKRNDCLLWWCDSVALGESLLNKIAIWGQLSGQFLLCLWLCFDIRHFVLDVTMSWDMFLIWWFRLRS